MNQKHTPAPWKAGHEFDFVWGENDEDICQMFDKFEKSFVNNEANARLIAAAPELLAVCEMVVGWLNDKRSDVSGVMVQGLAEKALAKARGEL